MHKIMTVLSKDLIAASATPLILSILSVEESYGYQIIRKISEISDDRIHWKEGTLYPVLHKMEKSGIIKSKWKVAENGRKRKYYQINKKGKKILDEELDHWRLIFNSLKKLWSEKGAEG
jgi:DNA-binding PadR family transcriptional regulator